MSSAYAKQKLKQSRDALAKKDWPAAAEAAYSVLEHETDNYNANVFLGLALLNQEKFDESEAAYLKATRDHPTQLLAWQGLQKFYDQRKTWDKLRDVLYKLMDLYNDAGEATKCAEAFQRLLALEREEGGRRRVIDTLSLLLHDSKYYDLLSTLEVPDQTQPEKSTTFETQMAIHVKSLETLLELIDLMEKVEADTIQKEADKRRMRLDGANKGKEALTNEVRLEVYSESRLPHLYEQVLSHPKARTSCESKWKRSYSVIDLPCSTRIHRSSSPEAQHLPEQQRSIVKCRRSRSRPSGTRKSRSAVSETTSSSLPTAWSSLACRRAGVGDRSRVAPCRIASRPTSGTDPQVHRSLPTIRPHQSVSILPAAHSGRAVPP